MEARGQFYKKKLYKLVKYTYLFLKHCMGAPTLDESNTCGDCFSVICCGRKQGTLTEGLGSAQFTSH
jgi:hypothetical protein